MTWRTILALAVFVGVCGFIAYAGDVLGRRMGKRRLSLFGLRPRYTAIVTTTITGMLIAACTIAVMTMVSKDVQQLVLRGERILRDYNTAVEDLRRQEIITDKARKEADEALEQQKLLAADIDLLTGELSELRENLKRNQSALADTEKQLKDARGDLTKANREIEARRREIEAQKAEIDSLEKQRSNLEHDLSVLLEDMGEIAVKWPRYIALRQGTVIFRSNEELARRVIRCAQTRSEIRIEVLGLMGDADRRARAEGATVGDNNRAIRILPKWWPGTGEPGEGRFLRDSESIDAIVDLISSSSGSVVARVVSVGNSVEGEQAMIDFVLNPNRLVYLAGAEVARTTIDGRLSQGQVLGQVINFLRAEVRPAAIWKGVIPYHDEEQEQPSVGQISPDQLLEVVDRVKATGKRVTLTAFAQVDTWSAGPLELDFRIEALE